MFHFFNLVCGTRNTISGRDELIVLDFEELMLSCNFPEGLCFLVLECLMKLSIDKIKPFPITSNGIQKQDLSKVGFDVSFQGILFLLQTLLCGCNLGCDTQKRGGGGVSLCDQRSQRSVLFWNASSIERHLWPWWVVEIHRRQTKQSSWIQCSSIGLVCW